MDTRAKQPQWLQIGRTEARGPVAIHPAKDYGPVMWAHRRSRASQGIGWLQWAGKHLLFGLALIATFRVAGEAGGGTHCAGHAVAMENIAHAATAHQHSGPSPAVWNRPTHSDCSHCPADQVRQHLPLLGIAHQRATTHSPGLRHTHGARRGSSADQQGSSLN